MPSVNHLPNQVPLFLRPRRSRDTFLKEIVFEKGKVGDRPSLHWLNALLEKPDSGALPSKNKVVQVPFARSF